MDGAGGLRLAAGAGHGRPLEQRLQAVPPGRKGNLGDAHGSSGGRCRPPWVIFDSTVVRTTPAPPGQKNEGEQALGRSRGGFSTKLHGLADILGNPLAFSLTAGQQATRHARTILDPVTTTAVIADKAYDTDAILEAIATLEPWRIPPKATRVHQRATDWHLYQQRHKIEILFGFMKHYRRVFAHSRSWRAAISPSFISSPLILLRRTST